MLCIVPGNTKMSKAEPLPWMKFYILESLLMRIKTKTKLSKMGKNVFENQKTSVGNFYRILTNYSK